MVNKKFTTVFTYIIVFTWLLPAGSKGQKKAVTPSLLRTTKPNAADAKIEKSKHRRVFIGEDVRVPCLTEKAKTLFSVGVNATYAWSQGKDATALGIRYAVQDNGDLYIKSLAASDSQILTCKVLAKSAEILEFKHQLSVVSVPDVEVGLMVHYNGKQCSSDVKRALQQKVQEMVEDGICKKDKVCKINEIYVACLKAGVGVKYQITLKTGVRGKLNYTCNEDCPRLSKGDPKQVRKNLHDFFKEKTIEIPEFSLKFKLPKKIHDLKEIPSCLKGFILNSQVCKPCSPGSYRSNVRFCELCAVSTFSDFYGASKCTDCPSNERTLHTGSDTASDCIEFDNFAVVILSILFIIIFIITPCCCPCAYIFYRYYKQTVRQTGQEPTLIRNIRFFFSVLKGVFHSLTSTATKQNDNLPEEQTPFLSQVSQNVIQMNTPQPAPSVPPVHPAAFTVPPGPAPTFPAETTLPPETSGAPQQVVPGLSSAVNKVVRTMPPSSNPVISVQPINTPQTTFPS